MSGPLRILHVDSGRTWRGGQRQVFELIRRQRERGDRPFLACPPGSPLGVRVRAESIPVHYVPMRGSWDIASVTRLARLAARGRPHVVHWHAARAHALGALAALIVREPCRVMARRTHIPVRRTLGSRLLYALPLDAIVAISEEVRASLVESGVSPARIETIPSGIDLAPFEAPADRAAARARFGVDSESRLVLTVGSLTEEKGPDLLLEAAALVRRHDPRIRFWIAGEGGMRARLDDRIRALDLADTVRLLGFREDIVDLLRASDVFCLPSRVEGLGSSILDAMAAGLPTIASRVGGIPEIVADGGTGLLVPVGDAQALAEAVLGLAWDAARCRAMGALARERVRGYASQRTEARTRALYERVIGRRGSVWERGA